MRNAIIEMGLVSLIFGERFVFFVFLISTRYFETSIVLSIIYYPRRGMLNFSKFLNAFFLFFSSPFILTTIFTTVSNRYFEMWYKVLIILGEITELQHFLAKLTSFRFHLYANLSLTNVHWCFLLLFHTQFYGSPRINDKTTITHDNTAWRKVEILQSRHRNNVFCVFFLFFSFFFFPLPSSLLSSPTCIYVGCPVSERIEFESS